MEGLNRWIGLGNLAADPDLKVTSGGTAVLKLRLACNESYVDKNNTRQERTEFVSVTMWGKRGEALARILRKGERILVEGSLRTTSFEKDGEKRYRTEVSANNVVLCGGGAVGGKNGGDAAGRGAAGRSRDTTPPDDDGEVPF